MGDLDAGLEAAACRALVAEVERRDAEERKGIAVALCGAGVQLQVVDDGQGRVQRSGSSARCGRRTVVLRITFITRPA
jgi:hypothetical protein